MATTITHFRKGILLQERLKELAEAPYTEIPFCAMCYSIIRYDPLIEYKCPKCGKTTHYEKDAINALERIKEIINELIKAGYDILFGELEYCYYCLGKMIKIQDYALQIRFDSKDDYHVVEINNFYDFIRLHAFLSGGTGYCGDRNNEDGMLHDDIAIIHKMTGLGTETVREWSKNHIDKVMEAHNRYFNHFGVKFPHISLKFLPLVERCIKENKSFEEFRRELNME